MSMPNMDDHKQNITANALAVEGRPCAGWFEGDGYQELKCDSSITPRSDSRFAERIPQKPRGRQPSIPSGV